MFDSCIYTKITTQKNLDKEYLKRKCFQQIKLYFRSNENLIGIMHGKEEIVNKIWSLKTYHLIDNDFLSEWKKYSKYEIIAKEMENKRRNIKDEDFLWISKILDNNKENPPKLDNRKLYYSMNYNETIKPVLDPMKKFEIIDEGAWFLFEGKKETLFSAEVKILKGNEKLIIFIDINNYIIKYKNKDKNSNISYLEFLVIFNPPYNPHKQKIIDDILKKDIIEWMNEVKFDANSKYFTIDYYGVPFDIKQKEYIPNGMDELSVSISKQLMSVSIVANNTNISLNSNESIMTFLFQESGDSENSISSTTDLAYVPKIVIQKVEHSTFVLSVIQSLSQITQLADYFFTPEKNGIINSVSASVFIVGDEDILSRFKNYIRHIWTDKEGSIYVPKSFLARLKKMNDNFTFKEEKDPYLFLKYLINQLNNELNDFDPELKEIFKSEVEKFKKYSSDKNLLNIFNNNNSIFSKLFMGILKNTISCIECGSLKIFYDNFYILNINLSSLLEYLSNSPLGNSFIEYNTGNLLKYFFDFSNENQKCSNCGKITNHSVEKKIFYPPKILIIHIDRGNFDENKGFDNQKEMEKCSESIELQNYLCSDYNNQIIKYNLVSMVDYPIGNEKKKFISICKSKFDKHWYFYCANSKVNPIKTYENPKIIPLILFYEREH